MKKKKREPIIVDKTLTPENAVTRRYIWWADSIYQPGYDNGEEEPIGNDFNPNDQIRDAVHNGALVGQAANPHTHKNVVGIYWPIEDEEDSE